MLTVVALALLLGPFGSSAELNSDMQDSVAAFSVNLLKEIFHIETGDVLVSPLGVYSLLAILQHGAKEDTRQKIDEVLYASAAETRAGFYNLTTSIEDSDSTESLRFWSFGKSKDTHTFTPTIEEILYGDYTSRFNKHQLPYYKRGNITIHTDVALSDKATRENFFDVVNLLAFYGLWSHAGLTHKNMTFSPKPFEELLVRAISMRKTCAYGECPRLGARWVHIPLAVKKQCACRNKPTVEEYWSTRNVSLLLVLPTERYGLADLIDRITARDVLNFIRTTSEDFDNVEITIPPFNINASIDFIPYLHKLGLQDIFEKSSDLTGFSSHQELYVTQATQDGQFVVDEYGARTKLYSDFHFPSLHKELSDKDTIYERFILNEPFLYFVVDEANGVPLFAGRVMHPVARNWNPFHEWEQRLKLSS